MRPKRWRPLPVPMRRICSPSASLGPGCWRCRCWLPPRPTPPRGLMRDIQQAPQFYLVLGIALLIGIQLAISGVNPIKALFYSQVLDGVIAPALVVLLLLLTSSRTVMGDVANTLPIKVIGWAAVAVLVLADVAMLYSVVTQGLPT